MEKILRHFTAWLTTESSCLATPFADVVVLEDELRGEPGDPGAWASTGDPLFTATTTVNAETGETDDAARQAAGLLAAGGWAIEGEWENYSNGAHVTVRPICKSCGDDLGEMYGAGYCDDSCARDGWAKQAEQEQAEQEPEKTATITRTPDLGRHAFYRIDYSSGTRSIARGTDLDSWITDLEKAGYRVIREPDPEPDVPTALERDLMSIGRFLEEECIPERIDSQLIGCGTCPQCREREQAEQERAGSDVDL